MGEILVPELEHLAADQDDGLGEHRRGELDDAMKALGVTDHRFLGGFGTYRDSGMKWHEDGHAIAADDVHDNAFWHADLTEAADHLVEVIREVRPQVLVTYDQFGGYGHPDHIQAHRVAMYAAAAGRRAVVPAATSASRGTSPRSTGARCRRAGCAQGLRALREAGDTTTFEGMDPDGPLPLFVTPDERPHRRASTRRSTSSRRWPRCARTPPRSPSTGRSSRCPTTSGSAVWGIEFFRIAKGTPGPVGEDGLETDLFAGL